MKKFLLYGIFISAFTLGFTACSDDDNGEPWTEPEVATTGVYILNSGSMNSDAPATLGYYNPDNNVYTRNVFQNQNGGMLIGNTGNDMVIYGSKMYILATGSNKIYITDLNGQLLKYNNGTDAIIDPVNDSGEPAGPRFALAHGGKVYVSTNAGYVARIDTISMVIERTATVGPNPEQMAIINNTLYTPNSGYGDGTTVSVVDLNSFTETKKITVTQNPTVVAADKNGMLYISSMGKTWGGSNVLSQLQRYNPATDELTVIGTDIASIIVANNDKSKIYILKESWGASGSVNQISYYDVNTGNIVEGEYFKLPDSMAGALDNAYRISFDPVSGDIYITTSDYLTNGDMYVFAADGTYKNSFDTGGMNPIGAYFVTGVK